MIACARMYAPVPVVSAAWRALFEWAATQACADLEVIEHAYPAPLRELWAREDMGCVFMCGLPYTKAQQRPQVIAAPVPSPSRYGGRPICFTDFVVRAESSYETLEDTFGGRLAYTTEDSHSGYNAARYHLLAYRRPDGWALYSAVVGPYVTPRRALEAVANGHADVAPLDSYTLDLMRRHTPDLVARVRVLSSTVAAPIPPLVASPGIDVQVSARLTETLVSAHRSPGLATVLDALLLARFAEVRPQDYEILTQQSRSAEAAGYALLA